MASSVTTSSNYSYSKSTTTYTIDQFIACQSDTIICYNNLSFIDQDDDHNIMYCAWNVLSDYIDEIREMCKTIVLSEEEFNFYKYRPKLLAYKMYGNGELFFIILIINDMYSFKQFTRSTILLPTTSDMQTITKQLYNSNSTAIQEYANASKLSI